MKKIMKDNEKKTKKNVENESKRQIKEEKKKQKNAEIALKQQLKKGKKGKNVEEKKEEKIEEKIELQLNSKTGDESIVMDYLQRIIIENNINEKKLFEGLKEKRNVQNKKNELKNIKENVFDKQIVNCFFLFNY